MEDKKYKEYREFLMKEKLSPITIGFEEVTEDQRKEARIRLKEVQKEVNKRLKELNSK